MRRVIDGKKDIVMNKLGTVVAIVMLLAWHNLAAQETSDEAAVWAAIELQWERQQRGDKRWTDELLAEDFMAWPNNSPAPQNSSSIRMWNEFNNKQAKTIQHELYPLSIVVHSDMAVAHYLYTQATESSDSKVTVSNGRYTDILVREAGKWLFISWHGGDDK
jgi:ketosteroid isomerase-like protein